MENIAEELRNRTFRYASRRLAAGSMGEVYKTRDTRLDRTVAIKVLFATRTFRAAAPDDRLD